MNEDRRSCDRKLVTSRSSSNVDLSKGDQPIFVKVASDYNSVSSSVVDPCRSITNIEAGQDFPKPPIAQNWLSRKSWRSSVERSMRTYTSSDSDSNSDESDSDDDYDSGDDLYPDSDSDSDSSSDSEEDNDKTSDGKRYRVSDKKSGRGCEGRFWLWGHSLKGIVFGIPPLTEM
ncbi:hypothetical protein MMC31_007767 [Peltigera leucophlebia]|nr:hypothetical protein [Peltigera leucophlebia]